MRTGLKFEPSTGVTSDRLNSWKEIATFFDKDVRTVRRWEETRKLPVHRMPGGGRSGVFAYVSQLEEWLQNTPAEDSEERAAYQEDLPPELEDVWEDPPETQSIDHTETSPTGYSQAISAAFPASDVAVEAPLQFAPQANTPFVERRVAAWPPPDLDEPTNQLEARPSRTKRLWTASAAILVIVLAAGIYLVRGSRPARSSEAHDISTPVLGRASTNPEAQELYLRGLYLWNQRTEQSLTQAVDLFTQSIVHDPRFAAAYSGLADCYLLLRQYGHMQDGEAFPRALAASRQALALDDQSPEAHRSYAFILNYWMWNFPEASTEFRRAIQLRPGDAQTHSWYATSLYSVGKYPEALREIDTARTLQPDSIVILANRGLLLASVDPKASVLFLKDLEKHNPTFPSIPTYLADGYALSGDLENELGEQRRAALLRGDKDEVALLDRAQQALATRGAQAMYRTEADGFAKAVDKGRSRAVQPAALYAQAGDSERALHYLAIACERHEAEFPKIATDPVYRPLAAQPAFKALLARCTPLSVAEAMKVKPATSMP